MVGTYFAPLPESAAPEESVVIDGQSVLRKVHRGMAAAEAIHDRIATRYDDSGNPSEKPQPEGKRILLEPSAIPLADFMRQEMAKVRSGFNYLGVRSIPELHGKMRSGKIRMEYVPPAR